MVSRENDTKGEIGSIGENAAAQKLIQGGHKIVARNYRKPWGEIDIVSHYQGVLHFVEVKTVDVSAVLREKLMSAPEERVDSKKRKRLMRTIQTFLSESTKYEDCDFHIDIASVYIDNSNNKVDIEFVEDVVL